MKTQICAKCIDNRGALRLEVGKEYVVIRTVTYMVSGEDSLYVLADGREYSSCHFTVTYLKFI
jgi:hypothetical protein